MIKTLKRTCSLIIAVSVILTAMLIAFPVKSYAAEITKHEVTYASDSVKVTLGASESGNKIYYTTNGSKPTKASKLYSARISAKRAFTLRAIELDKSGKKVSSIRMTVTPKVSQPKMSLVIRGGDTLYLRIKDATSGAVIRYTTDGSDPDINSAQYSELIPITEGSIVTAKAYKTGWTTSDTTSYMHDTVSDEKDFINEVYGLVNKARKENGVSELVLDEKLCEAAEIRVKEINDKYDHIRPDGSKCFTVFGEYGIKYNYAGENIAAGNRTPESVVSSWLKSERHRENILKKNYTKIGIGHYEVNGYHYWVQLFAG